MNVAILANGDPSVGLGHVARCIDLAAHLLLEEPAAEISFHGRFARNVVQRIKQTGFQVTDLPAAKNALLTPAVQGSDIVIVDDYSIDDVWLADLARHAGRTVCLSDFAVDLDHSGVDAVLDFTVEAEGRTYLSDAAFLGPRYYPVRPGFESIRDQRMAGDATGDVIYVCLGGIRQEDHLTAILLQALDDTVSGREVQLISSPGVVLPRAMRNRLRVHTSPQDMADVYRAAGIWIGAGGLMKYESTYCGIPNMSIALNPTQLEDSERMAALGLIHSLGSAEDVDLNHLRTAIRMFFSDDEVARNQMDASCRTFDRDSGKNAARGILHG